MQSNEQNSRFWRYLARIFYGFLAFLLELNLLFPDFSFSSLENRPLKGLPALHWNELVDGKYGQNLESYASDQFVGRNFMFHVSYAIRKAAGQREINDIFLGKDALQMQNSLPEQNFLETQIHAVNQFAGITQLPCSVLVAPSAATIQPDKLPPAAPVRDTGPAFDQLYGSLNTQKADVRAVLKEHAAEEIYYKTDHHWTSLGAKYGAQQLLASLGKEMNWDGFDAMRVSDSFEGTLASRTGSFGLKDDIFIDPDKNRTDYVVTWADGTKTASIYDEKALNRKDQYEVFLGKNQSLIYIETMAESTDNLLLFKDSYANSMVQYLIPYYRNIYIVDPRYYYDEIAYLLSIGSISQVAFVFSADNFFTDRSLQDILNPFNSAQLAAQTPQEEDGANAEEENGQLEDNAQSQPEAPAEASNDSAQPSENSEEASSAQSAALQPEETDSAQSDAEGDAGDTPNDHD